MLPLRGRATRPFWGHHEAFSRPFHYEAVTMALRNRYYGRYEVTTRPPWGRYEVVTRSLQGQHEAVTWSLRGRLRGHYEAIMRPLQGQFEAVMRPLCGWDEAVRRLLRGQDAIEANIFCGRNITGYRYSVCALLSMRSTTKYLCYSGCWPNMRHLTWHTALYAVLSSCLR
jgi:hypothetical protein